MASHLRAAALRRALAAVGIPHSPVPPPARSDYFSDHDWHLERLTREAMDSVAHCHRWRWTVTLTDGGTRRGYMRGTPSSVGGRLEALFPGQSHLLLIEPAPVQNAPEVFDRRLNLSLSTNRSY